MSSGLSFRSGLMLLAVFLIGSAFYHIDEEWKLKKDKNGIKVFTRKVDGYSLKEYKATMIVNAAPDAAYRLINDAEKYHEWQHNCGSARLIQKEGKNTSVIYVHTKAPFPVSDRDLVAKFTEQRYDDGGFRIDFKAVEGYEPINKPKVRMSYMKGYWIVENLGEGKLRIDHQVHADPAGKLPDWMINAAVVETPYKTLLNLKRLLEEG
ncbi:MAG: START domain-containing protein [Bacteroidota bacterium]